MSRTLVLLHGWGFHARIWDNFLPYLKKHFNVIALDLLGFGKNETTDETLTLDLLTKNVLKNAPDSAIFLGWSLGGLIAMNIAIRYPQRITQLITIASTPKFVADDQWPGMLPKVLEQFSQALKMDYQATLQQFIVLQFQGGDIDRDCIKSLKAQVANHPPSKRTLNDGLAILKNTDLRNELINIQCPQLYLLGRCDTLIPVTVAEKIMDLTHNATIEILPKVSHAPFLSNPKQCAEKMRAFLS